MRRVIVPLDGTEYAAAILPDARRLAGPRGELILIHDATVIPYSGFTYLDEQEQAVEASDVYLQGLAEALRADGVTVQTQTTLAGNAALAIEEATKYFHPDMVALATRARSGAARVLHGSIAWRTLAHSSVPVLIRHLSTDRHHLAPAEPLNRSILVPLDGSCLAERALPFAQELARESHAEIRLTQVISPLRNESGGSGMCGPGYPGYPGMASVRREAGAYLARIAAQLEGEIHTHVLVGSPVDALTAVAHAWLVSDIVMASHGRTWLSHAILGSVTDALIHRLDLPIIVVPVQVGNTMTEFPSQGSHPASSAVPMQEVRPGAVPEIVPCPTDRSLAVYP